jgi:uncharacterized protein involved in exopolysaccharide biosynthesis
VKAILSITALLTVAFVLGCKPSGEKSQSNSNETIAQKLDKAQTATKDAARELRDYTYEQRAEYVAAMKVELASLNQNLDELAAKIEKSSEAAQADAKPKLAALREQAAQLNKQLDAVGSASASTWSSIKAESEKAFAAVKDGVAQSRQWLSDKIAP